MRRRDLLKGAAGGGMALALGCAGTPGRRDVVRAENARPGTSDWMLTKTRVDDRQKFRCPWIEGYVSRNSVRAGEALDVFVSTNPPTWIERCRGAWCNLSTISGSTCTRRSWGSRPA